MKKNTKLAALILGVGLSLGVSFSANAAWTCASLCEWASTVCADENASFGECFEARRDCRFCNIP